MELENREPDETVNYTIEHPLKEFAWLMGGVLGLILVMSVLLGWFAGSVAAWLPFRYEREVADGVAAKLRAAKPTPAQLAAEKELTGLAGRLSAVMDLPADMQVTVHFSDDDTINAFATLGGNIVMFRGLTGRLKDENSVAMVLAHEIAHIKLRHPARALGRGVAVGIMLSVISSNVGRSAAGNVVGNVGTLTLLTYSREQERDADREALAALHRLYGHVGGAQDLFQVLSTASGGESRLQVAALATHPLTTDRIAAVASFAEARGWPLSGDRTPMGSGLAAMPAVPAVPAVQAMPASSTK